MQQRPFVLGVDLDGVCANFEAAFRRVVAAELDVDDSSLGVQTTWEFSDSGWPIRGREHFMDLNRAGIDKHEMYKVMEPIAGASDTLWRLSDDGVHIRIITHRLLVPWSHVRAATDTVGWLEQVRSDGRPLIPYRDLCFMADKTAVGADLYIDDAPHNIIGLRSAGCEVICFDTEYNRSIEGLRARNWDEVETIVRSRMATWSAGTVG